MDASAPAAITIMRLPVLLSVFILLTSMDTIYGQDYYDINEINTIELFFADSNWDQILDSLFAAGNEERLVGTAVINSIQFDSVGVRYKGQSTYHPDYIKNPLNVKLDHIIQGQLLDGHYGTLKLANVYQDPSFVREALSYEIARKYMAAGKANYANVYINNNLIGLYTNVQDVDRYFMIDHFNCVDQPRFKGVLGQNPQPTLWGYLGEDSTAYFDNYELESNHGWADLIEFLDVFNNNTAAVEDVLAVDCHLWMLAFDILTVNLDAPINMGQNFYLFRDASARFNPIIWDLNENFGVFRTLVGGSPLNLIQMQRLDPFLNISNPDYPIIYRILTDSTYQKIFIAHMKTIIEDNFSNGWYLVRALELQGIIDSSVQADPNKFYTYNDFTTNIENSVGSSPQTIVGITELMDARTTYLSNHEAFQGTAPVVTDISFEPLKVYPNTVVWFYVEVANADSVLLGYRQTRAGKYQKIQMYDDGFHNDGTAGDGIYGVAVHVNSGDINYYIYAENEEAAVFSPERAEHEYHKIRLTGGEYIALEQNFPNPFRNSTNFRYHIPVRSNVSLSLYDVAGRKIKTLVNEEKEAGSYGVTLSIDTETPNLAAGVYFAELVIDPTSDDQVNSYKGITKLVLIK